MDEPIKQLMTQGAYLGTSSWKYSGWNGLVYHQTYRTDKDFKENALEEYSKVFPTVGVDHTYYAFPSTSQLTQYDKQTPPYFRFVFKAPEQSTVYQFPKLSRYGKLAGTKNEHFLDASFLQESFFEPLKILGEKTGAVIFEFSRFRKGTLESGSDFVKRLDSFLKAVRLKTSVSIGVEIRNQLWLVPDYFKVLRDNQAAHVFNSWTYMPEIEKQWELASPFDLPFFLARLLLQPGTIYQDAVDAFFPYNKTHLELASARKAAADLIRHSMLHKKQTYVLVNNRFEGCAPKTIQGILDNLKF